MARYEIRSKKNNWNHMEGTFDFSFGINVFLTAGDECKIFDKIDGCYVERLSSESPDDIILVQNGFGTTNYRAVTSGRYEFSPFSVKKY